MAIRIYLLGRVGIERDWAPVVDERQFRGKQGRLAFAYLVCERTRAVSREELAGVVWPGEEMAEAWEVGLSALISRLRGLLAPLADEGVSLASGLGLYRLNLANEVWVDLEAGANALDMAEAALRDGEPKRGFGSAVVALNLAKRPFLSMNDGEWVEAQRRKLERQRLRALECLAKIWLASGEPLLAVESATEAVTLDPFRESSHRLLMQAHAATGNRPEALRVYHRLGGLLADELGTDPSAETEALFRELLR
jgi:DNA-binding SARP family transcriptional activator